MRTQDEMNCVLTLGIAEQDFHVRLRQTCKNSIKIFSSDSKK